MMKEATLLLQSPGLLLLGTFKSRIHPLLLSNLKNPNIERELPKSICMPSSTPRTKTIQIHTVVVVVNLLNQSSLQSPTFATVVLGLLFLLTSWNLQIHSQVVQLLLQLHLRQRNTVKVTTPRRLNIPLRLHLLPQSST